MADTKITKDLKPVGEVTEVKKPVEDTKPEVKKTAPAAKPVEKKAEPKAPAIKGAEKDESLAGTYKAMANTALRDGIGPKAKTIVAIPYGTEVSCDGQFTRDVNQVKHFVATFNGLTGFISATYARK